MPNWCDNSVVLRNSDKSKIDALDAVLSNPEDKQVLNHLRPNPSGEWDYNWSIENWGTKWDIGIIDWERRDDNEIWISFDSAWSPPTTIYEYLVEQGWEVEALYHECGMCYAGQFTTEGGDDYYEYDVSDPNFLDQLPSDVVEFAGLEDSHREWLINQLEDEWQNEERTDWYPVETAPVRDGWYEITTAGWDFPQFCEFKNGSWDTWNTITKWRGLTEDVSFDPEKVLEDLKREFDETKVD